MDANILSVNILSEEEIFLAGLVNRGKLTDESLREISGYYKPKMRLVVANNKRTPKDALLRLTNDKDKIVSYAAKKTLAALTQEQQGDE